MKNRHITLFFLCLLAFAVSVKSQTPISSVDDLAAIDMNGSYYLTNDLEVEGWTPLGVFTGSLDGRGHCVTLKGLVSNDDGFSGLFSVTNGADLRNLIVGGSCGVNTTCGSLVGRAVNTTIRNCETEMTIWTRNDTTFIGGLVGVMDGGSMYNCSSNATVEGYKIGGLVGVTLNGAMVKNCYTKCCYNYFEDEKEVEIGFLVHTNGGVLENNYVKAQDADWYLPSIGQLEMMYGARAIFYSKNSIHVGWADDGWISSSLFKPNNLYYLNEVGEMRINEFYYFNLSQTRPIVLMHDFYGAGHNVGDLLYVSGVRCFVFFVNEEGTGGWVAPLSSIIITGGLTFIENDALQGYYNSGMYLQVMNREYAQWHDGIVPNGDTVPVILDGYDRNPGKFYTYMLKNNDNDYSHKINKLRMPATQMNASQSVKQLAYYNNGEILNCFYPYTTSTFGLVKTGTVSQCTRYASSGAPYNYGYFGPYLFMNNQALTLAMVDSLNAWVGAQASEEFEYWAVPSISRINDNDPIHQYRFYDGLGTVNTAIKMDLGFSKKALRYGSINHLTDAQKAWKNTLAYYAVEDGIDADNVTTPWSCTFFVTDNARLKGNYRLKGNVVVTFDNSDASGFAGEAYDWHCFSPPLADAPVGINYNNYTSGGPYNSPSQVSFDNDKGYFPLNTPYAKWDFYCYDEPNDGWPNFKRRKGDHYHHGTGVAITYNNETNLTPGKGYLWAIGAKTGLQAFGTLNNGNVTRSVTCNGLFYPGYNLIGNPYHAYLDFDAFAAENASILAQDSYVVLDADKQGYISYCPGASENPNYASRYLSPNQGFFVKVTGNGSVAFKTDQSLVNVVSPFRGAVSYPLINMKVSDALGRNDYATVELERPEAGGALKMSGLRNGDGMISVCHDSQEYGIAFLEGAPGSIPIRFRAFDDGEFTLSWELRDLELGYLHLIDHLTGIETDCLKESSYCFHASVDDYPSRFKLMLAPTEVEEFCESEYADFAFFSHGTLTIEGHGCLSLYDLQGRLLRSALLEGSLHSLSLPDLASGVYLIRLTADEGTRIQKIIIP